MFRDGGSIVECVGELIGECVGGIGVFVVVDYGD